MILQGSNPDQLAQQQNYYDSLYGRANEVNSNTLSQAQLEQVKLALQQQNSDQQSADAQSRLAQQQGWQSNENVLDRASKLADVQAQAGSDKQREVDFRLASKQAQDGALNPDKATIRAMYPHFRDDQVDALVNLAGQASLTKAQIAAENATKTTGGPPDFASVLLASGAKNTPFEDKVKEFVTSLQQPFAREAQTSSDLADSATRLMAIKKDQTDTAANPVPTSGGFWSDFARGIVRALPGPDLSQSASGIGIRPDAVAQPSSRMPSSTDVGTRLAALTKQIAAPGSMVAVNPAGPGMISTAPANWRPAFAPQPVAAPVAQAVPPIAAALPPPPITPAPVAPAVPTIPHVNSAAEYDALPDGAQYYDSRGKMATKRKRKSS